MTDPGHFPLVTDLLGGSAALPMGARLLPFWPDLQPGRNLGLDPAASLHVWTDTSGGPGNAVCDVTWYRVGEANSVGVDGLDLDYGHAVRTLQLVSTRPSGAARAPTRSSRSRATFRSKCRSAPHRKARAATWA